METPYVPCAEGPSLSFCSPAESYDFATKALLAPQVSLLLVAPAVFHVFSEIVRDLIAVSRFGNRLFYIRA